MLISFYKSNTYSSISAFLASYNSAASSLPLPSSPCFFIHEVNTVTVTFPVSLLFSDLLMEKVFCANVTLQAIRITNSTRQKEGEGQGISKNAKIASLANKSGLPWRHAMKTLSLIVLVLSFAITSPVIAADKDDRYLAQGSRSCGQWIEFRKEDGWQALVVEAWIAGYITAYNYQTPDVLNILGNTDITSVFLWTDKYCQENPLSRLHAGMDVLTKELWPNRKRTKDD